MLTRSRHLARVFAAVALASAALVHDAAAQVNIQPFADFDFDANPPGARAAAMGGVFVPLADDATAAEANPAGLVNLLRPEVSFELKVVETQRTVTEEAGGGAGGAEFTNTVASPAFASLVYPIGRLSVALFYSEVARIEGTNFGTGIGEFDTTLDRTRVVVSPFTNTMSLEVIDFGAAIGYTITPALSIGASAGYARMSLELDHARYSVQRFDEGFRRSQATITGDDGRDQGIFYTVGILARAGEVGSIGIVYNARPDFDDLVLRAGVPSDTSFQFAYNLPDSYSAGFALRFTELFTVAGEMTYQQYSELSDDFVDFFSTDEKSSEDFRTDDGIDVKAGVELITFLRDIPVALRAGAASLAPSNVYFMGDAEGTRALFGTHPEDRRTLYTAGLGLAQLLGRINVDVAVKLGSDRRELNTSVVYRFE